MKALTRLIALLVVASLAMVATEGSGLAAEYGSGPVLREDRSDLRAALSCTPDVATSSKRAVLLVHGTGAKPEEDFGVNLALHLPRHGYPVCMVTIPDRAVNDLQVNVEYVVWAIRWMYARSDKKVAVIGHSQGAFLPSYALRFWPDLASKVSDLIGYAGTYTYGTDAAKVCVAVCPGALWQFRPDSRFLEAVAAQPMPRGPSYTTYSTRLDEVVVPQPKAGVLRAPGVRSYVLQDLCPLDVAEHNSVQFERPFLAITLDALAHRGPGMAERLEKVPCGLLPQTPVGATAVVPFALDNLLAITTNPATREPRLRCYLRPACG